MEDPGFPRGRPPWEGARVLHLLLLYLTNFFRKLHENEEILAHRGAPVPGAHPWINLFIVWMTFWLSYIISMTLQTISISFYSLGINSYHSRQHDMLSSWQWENWERHRNLRLLCSKQAKSSHCKHIPRFHIIHAKFLYICSSLLLLHCGFFCMKIYILDIFIMH